MKHPLKNECNAGGRLRRWVMPHQGVARFEAQFERLLYAVFDAGAGVEAYAVCMRGDIFGIVRAYAV